MRLQDVAGKWAVCPQEPCKKMGKRATKLIKLWAGVWDRMVDHVTKRTALVVTGTVLESFDKWAGEVLAHGKRPAREVLANLERIRKGADITPEMAERWNNALLPFIQASESALARAIAQAA